MMHAIDFDVKLGDAALSQSSVMDSIYQRCHKEMSTKKQHNVGDNSYLRLIGENFSKQSVVR